VRVLGVREGTEAARAGFRADDDLIAVDGRPVHDSLDLAFALGSAEGGSVRCRLARGRDTLEVAVAPSDSGDLGADFADDEHRVCGNHCVFCFVDQLPGGLRRSLYVKDEDFRLSFRYGNYVTLTNLSDSDYERIAEQRLSPLYVSVHATDDAVRRRMLGNPGAPPVLGALRRLSRARVAVHAQVVVCPGVNDGPVLERTLDDLVALRDTVRSVAVVPVGLTAHRGRLTRIEPVAPALAAALVDAVERRQPVLRRERGSAVVFAADELYLLAGRALPPLEAYEDLPQIEDGVGLLRSFEAELTERAALLAGVFERPVSVAVLTGTLAAPFLQGAFLRALRDRAPVSTTVVPVTNTLLGASVTVAGLLPGSDLARSLPRAGAFDLVLLPGEAFNENGLTLDGMTAGEIAGGRRDVVATRDAVAALLDLAASRAAARRDDA
jgi:putative radical SAM enzyme (TIGR03279 family)